MPIMNGLGVYCDEACAGDCCDDDEGHYLKTPSFDRATIKDIKAEINESIAITR